MPSWQAFALFGVLTGLAWASLHDLATRTLPNWVVVTLAGLSLLTSALAGTLVPGIVASSVIFVLAAFCWRRGWMGGGDVKLLGAVALGITPPLIPEFITAVALAGGILSLIYLGAKHLVPTPGSDRPIGFLPRILRIEQWRVHRGCPLPYACAIAAGTLYVHL